MLSEMIGAYGHGIPDLKGLLARGDFNSIIQWATDVGGAPAEQGAQSILAPLQKSYASANPAKIATPPAYIPEDLSKLSSDVLAPYRDRIFASTDRSSDYYNAQHPFDDPNAAYNRIKQLLESGDTAGASALFRQQLGDDPSTPHPDFSPVQKAYNENKQQASQAKSLASGTTRYNPGSETPLIQGEIPLNEEAQRKWLLEALQKTLIPPPNLQGARVAERGEGAKESADYVKHMLAEQRKRQTGQPFLEKELAKDLTEVEGPLRTAMTALTPSEIQQRVRERGMFEDYKKDELEKSQHEFEKYIKPRILNQFAQMGQGWHSSARDEAVNRARTEYLKETSMQLRKEEKALKQQEYNRAYEELTHGRTQAIQGAQALQGKHTQEASRLGHLSAQRNALNEGETKTGLSLAEARKNEAILEQAHKQRLINERRQEYQEQRQAPQAAAMALINASNKVPLAASQLTPSSLAQAPQVVAPNLPLLGQNFLSQALGLGAGGQGQTFKKGGLTKAKYADGGEVHLPPEYSDQQLPGMNTPEINAIRQHAIQTQNYDSNPIGAYFRGVASRIMPQKGETPFQALGAASGAGMGAYESAHRYGHERHDKASAMMGKINDSRLAQKEFMANYHMNQQKENRAREFGEREFSLAERRFGEQSRHNSAMEEGQREIQQQKQADRQYKLSPQEEKKLNNIDEQLAESLSGLERLEEMESSQGNILTGLSAKLTPNLLADWWTGGEQSKYNKNRVLAAHRSARDVGGARATNLMLQSAEKAVPAPHEQSYEGVKKTTESLKKGFISKIKKLRAMRAPYEEIRPLELDIPDEYMGGESKGHIAPSRHSNQNMPEPNFDQMSNEELERYVAG
jgi:hypothetical protein